MHIATGLAVLLITGLLGFSKAQNCALPQSVILTKECYNKTECANPGTILAILPRKNVETILRITQTPEDFARVEFSENEIQLLVNRSLLPTSSSAFSTASHIDKTWSEGIELDAEFKCSDGNKKTVHFTIPIHDENTASPSFERDNYTLIMGPCYNGTHRGRCPLNFETSIRVFDQDRDILNAEVLLYPDKHAENHISIELAKEEFSMGAGAEGLLEYHQKNVHLYLYESTAFSVGQVLEFDLTVYNIAPSPTREKLFGKTTITIIFGETEVPDNGTILEPPEFTSYVYYAEVSSSEVYPGMELQLLNGPIFAYFSTTDSGDFGYGDGEEGDHQFNIKYSMVSEVLEIEEETGVIHFKSSAELMSTLTPEISTFQVRATVKTHAFLWSTVPLVVYFDVGYDKENSTETPPFCPTPCPECPVTECPPTDVTCPDPIVVCPQPTPTTTVDWSEGTSTVNYDTTATLNPTTSPYPEPSTWNPIPTSTLEPIPTSTLEPIPTSTSEPIPTSGTPVSTTSTTPTETTDATTDSDPYPTTDVWTTELPTETTENIPSTTPEESCDNCGGLLPFLCPEGDYRENLLLPDPQNCNMFYFCLFGGSGRQEHAMNCRENLDFCPELQECIDPTTADCPCTAYAESSDAKGYETITDNKCVLPNDPRNICEENGYENGTFPDPRYCNIFHDCRPDPLAGSIDCYKHCPTGTLYCPELEKCGHIKDCPCGNKEELTPSRCNICRGYYLTENVTLPF